MEIRYRYKYIGEPHDLLRSVVIRDSLFDLVCLTQSLLSTDKNMS